MTKNLRTFLSELARIRPSDFRVVEKEVDPRCGVTAYVEKFEDQGENPIVFFKKVKGTELPVIANVHSEFDRIALSMQSTSRPEAVLEFALRSEKPVPADIVKNGPVKDVILTGRQAKISILPQITHNEYDGGPYISSGATVIKDPDTGIHNLGIYRNQIRGNRIGIMTNPASHGRFLMNRYVKLRKPMEAAIITGHHPAFFMATGGARLPYVGGEYDVVGGLLREPLKLVKGETVDLYYPSDAEIVVEGVVDDVSKLEEEGNFGEYPRYYSGKKMVPFMRVTGICMRRDAIYQDIIAAHGEHITLGSLPRMATYLQRIKANVPYVKMVNLPRSGSSRSIMYLSIRKSNDGEGKHAGLAALAADPNVKMVVVVDDDIDVFNEEQVWWAVAFRFEADRDLVMIPYTIGAHLNPSAYSLDRTSKGEMQTRLILDATWPARPFKAPPVARASPQVYNQTRKEDCKVKLDAELLQRLNSEVRKVVRKR